ncbi:hypothetical protein QYF36_022853 [Acer negundo]|nr:hypothetical protein QYF36_022853 [Acer negundo]
MEYNTMMSVLVWSSLFLSAALILLSSRKKKSGNGNQPPGPPENIEEDTSAVQTRGELGEVDLSQYLFFVAFNLLGKLTLSRDLLDSQSKEGQEFVAAMKKVVEWTGKPNLADFLPFLKRLDPQGIKRNLMRDMGCSLKIMSGFVKERVEEQCNREKTNKDFLDGLLEYEGDGKEGPDRISDQNVKITILEMFFAGSETTSSTIEGAIAELLRNPEFM